MKECKNCGMPMVKKDDFGNNDPKSVLCKHCYCDKSIATQERAENAGDNKNEIISIEDLDKIDDIDIF